MSKRAPFGAPLGILLAIAAMPFGTAVAELKQCQARVDRSTGWIQAFASNASGIVRWGTEPNAIEATFFNDGSCNRNGRLRGCVLDDPIATDVAKTPPASCTLFFEDESGDPPCAAIVAGCTPSPRDHDHDGAVFIDAERAMQGQITRDDSPGFPVTIVASGLYRLASNLTVPASKNVIDIQVPDVTIDLNGFVISGGDRAINGDRNTVVRNGHIINTGDRAFVSRSGRVHSVYFADIGGSAITVGNNTGDDNGDVSGCVIERASATAIDSRGIVARNIVAVADTHPRGFNPRSAAIETVMGAVEDNLVVDAGQTGIAGSGSVIVGNLVLRAGMHEDPVPLSAGIRGFGLLGLTSSNIRQNLVLDGNRDGIEAASGTRVADNYSRNNSEFGLTASQSGAYGRNLFDANSQGQVAGGGVQLGKNQCEATACP